MRTALRLRTLGALVLGTGSAWAQVPPTQSSPIALHPTEPLLLNVNPDLNTVTLFDVTADQPVKLAELKVGKDPSSVAVSRLGNLAFVTNAFDGTVTPIDLARRKAGKAVKVGAEPRAACCTPNGRRLYVANSASNTISVFNGAVLPLELVAEIDLSEFGTAPRAIAVSSDGDTDDTDEQFYVAMFFGQLRSGRGAIDEGQDDQREGRVVRFDVATNQLVAGANNPSRLGPIANSGFNANGRLAPASGLTPSIPSTNPQTFTTPTGCYPNQLASIAAHPTVPQVFVVSTGASPNGPLRFNHMAQGMVSAFDVAQGLEVVRAQVGTAERATGPLNLNQGVNLDTSLEPKLFHTNPTAITWRPNGDDAWIAIQNSNLLLRMRLNIVGAFTIGAPLVAGSGAIVRVDLENPGGAHLAGKAPRGIAIDSTGTRAFVHNYISRSVSVVDISNATAPIVVGSALSTKLPKPGTPDAVTQLGAELFHTGRGPDGRMSSESWGGCIVCHPQGLSDNVTWMFDAGPRQTIALDGITDPRKKKSVPHRILNWSALRDENSDFELNTRNVFGGRGLIDDDRLFFLFGGGVGAAPGDITAINQYNQVNGAISSNNDLADGAILPLMPTSRRDVAAAALDDGRIFVIGGRRGTGQGSLIADESTVFEFDPRTNLVTNKSSSGFTPRHSHGAAAVNTRDGARIYVIGGYASTAANALPELSVQEFDPARNRWRTVQGLAQGVANFGIAVAGGANSAEPLQQIHVVGGNTGSESAPSVETAAVVQRITPDPRGLGQLELFNPAGLNSRRNHGIATALRGANSRIFLVGGRDANGSLLATVQEYQAQNVAFVDTVHTNLPAPRELFGISSSLTTNQVYVFGGKDAAGDGTNTVFEYTINTQGASAGPAGTPSGVWATRPGVLPNQTFGIGVPRPPSVNNYLSAPTGGRDPRQDAITAWVTKKIRSSRAPLPASDPAVVRGRQLFGQVGLATSEFSCATCHGGPKWTRSAVDFGLPPSPEVEIGFGDEQIVGAELRRTRTQGGDVLSNVGTFTLSGRVNEIRFNGADISQTINPLGAAGFNIPSLLSLHETGPYFYNGLAQTLEQVLDGSQDGNGGVRVHFVQDAQQRADLVAFLKSIEGPTKAFPLD
jgi:DNA-binding beta-propeller fold protein YncE